MPSVKKAFIFITTLSFANIASADYMQGQTVGQVGGWDTGAAGGTGVATAVWISPNTSGCLYGRVIYSSASSRDRALTIALTAKTSGKTVRVDFTKAANNVCNGTGIYIE